MKFSVNPDIFDRFDNPRIGVVVVKGLDNHLKSLADIEQKTTEVVDHIRQTYKSETYTQQPSINAWREAHRLFGSKPKDYPSSVEALYRRILKGQDVGNINPLVDIYNYISLKYMVPVGGEDLDEMHGDLQLTFATDNEVPVTVLGKDEAQAPKEGEVVYKDDIGTICRRWNWREVARTILTEKTTNAILVIEAIGSVEDKQLLMALTELQSLVHECCGGETNKIVLTEHNTSVEI